MLKKSRILSLGMAMGILFAQTAYAEIMITPLDTAQTAQEIMDQQNNKQEPGIAPGQNQESGQALVSSGSYSTKEPVIRYADGAKKDPQSVPNGAASQNGQAYQSGSNVGPGYEEENTRESNGSQNGLFVNNQAAEANLPEKPEILAEAGILYDVTHDRVLFEKNADEKLYPASITKLMTALLVLEHAGLNDVVTFSKTAVTDLESGAVTLKLAEGDQVSVKDCLYGLLLKSANEVANGLAEHVGGSISGFAGMMNAKAAALGCTNTHFVNPNGLNDPDHYTTCRDMAKIAKAAFENPYLCQIASTLTYQFPATKNAAERTIAPGHKMLYESDSRFYEGIIGGKTGYTSLAGNTLVTCVEKDGVRMVAVILKARSSHYEDTKAILDYGYALNAAGSLGSGQDLGQNGADSLGMGSGTVLAYHKWIQDGSTWRFELADGSRILNRLVTIDGVDYAFDAEGKMMTGWRNFDGAWYCFDENGGMVKNGWRQDGGKWFYLGNDGRMVKNAVIDGQYYVGNDGAWVQQ